MKHGFLLKLLALAFQFSIVVCGLKVITLNFQKTSGLTYLANANKKFSYHRETRFVSSEIL